MAFQSARIEWSVACRATQRRRPKPDTLPPACCKSPHNAFALLTFPIIASGYFKAVGNVLLTLLLDWNAGFGRAKVEPQFSVMRKNDRSFDCVLEFTNVSGPRRGRLTERYSLVRAGAKPDSFSFAVLRREKKVARAEISSRRWRSGGISKGKTLSR